MADVQGTLRHDALHEAISALGYGPMTPPPAVGTAQARIAALGTPLWSDVTDVASLLIRPDLGSAPTGTLDVLADMIQHDQDGHLSVDFGSSALIVSVPRVPEGFSFGPGMPGVDYAACRDRMDAAVSAVDQRREAFAGRLYRTSLRQLRRDAAKAGMDASAADRDTVIGMLYDHEHGSDVQPSEPAGVFLNSTGVLVVRARMGSVAGDVCAMLADAALHGRLGASVVGPGRDSLLIYDAHEESVRLRDARVEYDRWVEDRMSDLAPVRDALERDGYEFHLLGRPTPFFESGEVVARYWLHSKGVRRGGSLHRPVGWFTLDEISSRTFVTGDAFTATSRAS